MDCLVTQLGIGGWIIGASDPYNGVEAGDIGSMDNLDTGGLFEVAGLPEESVFAAFGAFAELNGDNMGDFLLVMISFLFVDIFATCSYLLLFGAIRNYLLLFVAISAVFIFILGILVASAFEMQALPVRGVNTLLMLPLISSFWAVQPFPKYLFHLLSLADF